MQAQEKFLLLLPAAPASPNPVYLVNPVAVGENAPNSAGPLRGNHTLECVEFALASV